MARSRPSWSPRSSPPARAGASSSWSLPVSFHQSPALRGRQLQPDFLAGRNIRLRRNSGPHLRLVVEHDGIVAMAAEEDLAGNVGVKHIVAAGRSGGPDLH